MTRDELAQKVAVHVCGIADANPDPEDYALVDLILSNLPEGSKR